MCTGCCIELKGMHQAKKVAGIYCEVLLPLLILVCPQRAVGEDGVENNWPMGGQNIHNTRYAAAESQIGPETAGSLAGKWAFTTGGDVSATPTVEGKALYVPDWGGHLYKIDTETGHVHWSRQISDYNGIPGSVSRNSPLVMRDKIILGDQNASFVMAIHADTGRLVWKTRADPNENAIITQSPVGYGDRVFVGVASGEEGVAALVPGYVPTFRGSVLALNADTGGVLWRTYIVPPGYTGGAVWGSTPVVDLKRNSLYIATGNNYTVPASVAACIAAAGNNRKEAEECLASDDYMDAIVSLDLATGAIKWARRLQGADTWTVSCIVPMPANPCPVPAGPDYDFGSGPNLFTVTRNGQTTDFLGAGQKSGIYWALNPDNGTIVWSTQVGPGGGLGGIQWGSATDGHRVYVAISNSDHKPYRLTPSGVLHNAGSWAALDASSGRVLWQVKVPGADPSNPSLGALGVGAVTVGNGVVYAGATTSGLYALDATTGRQLWSFPVSAPVICGPSVVNGTVYWGTGYGGSPANKLYAFEVRQPARGPGRPTREPLGLDREAGFTKLDSWRALFSVSVWRAAFSTEL